MSAFRRMITGLDVCGKPKAVNREKLNVNVALYLMSRSTRCVYRQQLGKLFAGTSIKCLALTDY